MFERSVDLLRSLGSNELAKVPVRLVVEIQLHLDYYIEARKKTHLWFKVARAAKLEDLQRDCAAYRNVQP